jgi:hypothetical protein
MYVDMKYALHNDLNVYRKHFTMSCLIFDDQYYSLYSQQHSHYSLSQIIGRFVTFVDSNELET